MRDLAACGDERRSEDVVRGEPVLQAVRSAGILRDVPADGADLLRRGIRSVEVPERPYRFAHLEIGHAGLDGHLEILEVDIENRSHAAETDDDTIGDGERPAGEPGAGAARDKRHIRLDARAHRLCHLLGCHREDDGRGGHPPSSEPIACIGLHGRGSGDEPVVANR